MTQNKLGPYHGTTLVSGFGGDEVYGAQLEALLYDEDVCLSIKTSYHGRDQGQLIYLPYRQLVRLLTDLEQHPKVAALFAQAYKEAVKT